MKTRAVTAFWFCASLLGSTLLLTALGLTWLQLSDGAHLTYALCLNVLTSSLVASAVTYALGVLLYCTRGLPGYAAVYYRAVAYLGLPTMLSLGSLLISEALLYIVPIQDYLIAWFVARPDVQ